MSQESFPSAAASREEQAGEWCVRLSEGSLDVQAQAAFEHWRTADPANTVALDRALRVWSGLQEIGNEPEVIAQRAAALEAMRRANQERWGKRPSRRWAHPLALAASLIAVIMIGATWLAMRPQVYTSAVGERRVVQLADGSRLSLDADSWVSVDLRDQSRILKLLKGRAKFDVAHDPQRPFAVEAAGRTAIATGTAFSVEVVNRRLQVIVYQGSVVVAPGQARDRRDLLATKARPGSGTTSLSPGQQLSASEDGGGPTRVSSADAARSLVWETGQLDFVDEPLEAAVTRMNRYSAKKLVIGDEAARSLPINGVFNAGDSAAFVEAIVAAYPIRTERSGTGETVLRSAGS
ncbi:FecR domain-containing protein [uncultured Caulobacter sp.]|uniref:FecR family protein n=1 Tax=uncultured Caulobacter sp. TaxID=158749 RepID=UPI002638C7D2|nr:FecR domain-containing protein [uncultured Caulobacter sp.]